MLATSSPYSFTATASQDNSGTTVTGSATVSIAVASSPLYIELSKAMLGPEMYWSWWLNLTKQQRSK
ncbi:unnamed protein product [Blepharisma stoltei]|uniref:Uncharacterized protein n=1 Tax=Blepharisma stoltei TaxID=1481888 RepID=A0AAU9J0A9_9CILI|nr:unnamed protein product [Blepharisma stoltei]